MPKVAKKLLRRQNVQNVEQQNVAEHNRDRPNPDIPEIVEFPRG